MERVIDMLCRVWERMRGEGWRMGAGWDGWLGLLGERRGVVDRFKRKWYNMGCQCFAIESFGVRYDEICSGTEPQLF